MKRRETQLGRDHLHTLRTVGNLGVNYKDAGRLQEAIPLLEEAYRAGQEIPQAARLRQPLLDAYAKAGEHAKFANLLQEQLSEARKALPKDSPHLAGLLAQIGLGLLEQQKWTAAEPLLARVPGHPHQDTARRLVDLQLAVAARRRAAGPEEVRRGRTAAAGWLRRHEAAGKDHSAAG